MIVSHPWSRRIDVVRWRKRVHYTLVLDLRHRHLPPWRSSSNAGPAVPRPSGLSPDVQFAKRPARYHIRRCGNGVAVRGELDTRVGGQECRRVSRRGCVRRRSRTAKNTRVGRSEHCSRRIECITVGARGCRVIRRAPVAVVDTARRVMIWRPRTRLLRCARHLGEPGGRQGVHSTSEIWV